MGGRCACLNHHFFEHHGGGLPPFLFCRDFIARLFESSLLQTSWGGGGLPPPNPPATFYCFFSLFFFTGVEMTSYLNHYLFDPSTRQLLFVFFTHDLLVMLGMLVGQAGDDVKYINFARQCCKIRHFTGQDEKQKTPQKISSGDIPRRTSWNPGETLVEPYIHDGCLVHVVKRGQWQPTQAFWHQKESATFSASLHGLPLEGVC